MITSSGTADVTFTGQSQNRNNSTDHLGAYDYMYASAVSPTDGNALFTFKHKVSIIKVTVPISKSGKYSNLTLKSDKSCFAQGGKLSISDGSMTALSKSKEIDLALENFYITKGNQLVAWIVAMPCNEVTGATFSAVLTSEDGTQYPFDIDTKIDTLAEGKVYELSANPETSVIFKDTFDWVKTFIPDGGCPDFVNGTYDNIEARIDDSNNNSTNLYNTYPDTFPAALSKAGYSDQVPTNKVIYAQGTKANPYLKFCKKNTQTALILQPFAETYETATISLDWAVHMTNSALDATSLQIRIEGDGQFSNRTKISDPFTLSQTEVATPVWSHATAEVTGVNSSTRLLISSSQAFEGNFAASGQHRFYLDNIIISTEKIIPVDPILPEPGSTVYGIVKCGTNGIANVVVSDGYETTTTNEKGIYQLASKKKNGFVFISIPSGYEVGRSGVLPLFHRKLYQPATTAERVDFTLYEAGNQDNHTILYLGDMHLANRTNDRKQFKVFTTEISNYVKEHSSEKIYAITMGDMTWDLYWYTKNYSFEQYLGEYTGVVSNLQIFHTIGNHDHDMNKTGDWDTMLRFREAICPNYYSFNIGKIHYVILDDIECTNNPPSTTDGAGRSYNEAVVNDILNWLRKDLSYVPKTTPVVVAMHAPVYKENESNNLNNTTELTNILSGYNVTFISGHTHVCYTVDKSSSIREYNSGAVCAAWWWAGKYFPEYNIATDGSPSGYRVMSVNGTKQTSYFKAVGKDANYQFRAYDRNQINFDLSMVPSSAQSTLWKELALSVIFGNYSGGSSSNDVIINVWDWNSKWKIEVTENGKSLTVNQKTLMDPSFYIAYTIPHLNNGNNSVTWHPSSTNHMFVVSASSPSSTLNIKVTDDEGRVYTETMKRPRAFTIENYTNY